MKNDFENDIICESTGKICYSKKEAGKAINGAKKRHYTDGHSAKKIPRRKYYCEKCGCYHLTHLTFYKSDKPQRGFKHRLRKLIAFENDRAWREERSLLYAA